VKTKKERKRERKKERKQGRKSEKFPKYMYASIHPFHVTSLHEVQILGDISLAIFLLKGNDIVLIAIFSYVFVTKRKKNSFRSVLFWDVTQRIIVILCRHFGTTFWSHFQMSRNCS